MFSRRLKTGYFVLEGLHSFSTTYFFYYFYFFMNQRFGFDNKANLALAAANGAVYVVAAWWGGRFAQRAGYFAALKWGFGLMLAALVAGLALRSAPGQITVMMVATLGVCFTWPTLEALVSEGEPRAGLQQMVGLYNVVWAATAALANFSGGAMLEHLGPQSLFYVPIAFLLGQMGLTVWLERQAGREARMGQWEVKAAQETELHAAPERAAVFLRMAWLANPFAYIGINTLIAVVPGITGRLGLSTMMAGFCCSVWSFARLGAFFGLWYWAGWHYRLSWLLLAFVGLIGSFAAILLVPSLPVLVAAQIVFGVAVGLIYYSSLFYSMDVGETKGEHGGIHEAAIGVGNFAGPAVGAAALQFMPYYPNSGAVAVSLLLLCGLGGLGVVWRRDRS